MLRKCLKDSFKTYGVAYTIPPVSHTYPLFRIFFKIFLQWLSLWQKCNSQVFSQHSYNIFLNGCNNIANDYQYVVIILRFKIL